MPQQTGTSDNLSPSRNESQETHKNLLPALFHVMQYHFLPRDRVLTAHPLILVTGHRALQSSQLSSRSRRRKGKIDTRCALPRKGIEGDTCHTSLKIAPPLTRFLHLAPSVPPPLSLSKPHHPQNQRKKERKEGRKPHRSETSVPIVRLRFSRRVAVQWAV